MTITLPPRAIELIVTIMKEEIPAVENLTDAKRIAAVQKGLDRNDPRAYRLLERVCSLMSDPDFQI